MIYKVGLLASWDFENLLLDSAWLLEIIEITPLIMLSTNWYVSVSEISFKLTSVNLNIASQLYAGVDN